MSERNDTDAFELESRIKSGLTRLQNLDPAVAPQLAGDIADALAAALDDLDES